jgi:hypothetical protein
MSTPIDSLSKNKPAGQTYFVLWCRAWDESMLTIEIPQIFAAETGFTGERALTTWRERMRTLKQLGFIDTKTGASGEHHYILILNPHLVMVVRPERLRRGLRPLGLADARLALRATKSLTRFVELAFSSVGGSNKLLTG